MTYRPLAPWLLFLCVLLLLFLSVFVLRLSLFPLLFLLASLESCGLQFVLDASHVFGCRAQTFIFICVYDHFQILGIFSDASPRLAECGHLLGTCAREKRSDKERNQSQ